MEILLHVNYLEGDGNALERLFRLAADNGCDGVELRWRYRYQDRTQAQYQETVAALKDRYPDLTIVFGGCIDFCRGEAETVRRDTEQFEEFLLWAKQACGTPLINFFTGVMVRPGGNFMEFDRNGSGMAEEADFDRAAAGLRRVGDRAAELGMKIALETHNGYLHDLATPCRKLMERTHHPAVGLNYDQGNIQLNRNGETIEQVFDIAGRYITYAHLKNLFVLNGAFVITHLDQGMINQRKVLDLLQKTGTVDRIAIEYPSTGDGTIAARRDMEYIRFLQEQLQF